MISANCSADLSPISKIDSSSFTSVTDFSVAAAVSVNSKPTRTSTGTGISVLAANSFATGIKSSSYKDLPTL